MQPVGPHRVHIRGTISALRQESKAPNYTVVSTLHKTIAQHLRVSAHIFPTRYSEHLGRVECLIYLLYLPL